MKQVGCITLSRSAGTRKRYVCANPNIAKYPASVFKNGERALIGLGDASPLGQLKLKTHPRWCPLERLGDT